MFSLADLTEGNEHLKALLEDEETEKEEKLTEEEKVEVESEVVEEEEVADEAEESVDEVEEVVEATEVLLATFERAEAVMNVIREYGYTKPIAMILNHGQTDITRGDLERGFGVILPSNESLELVSSKYDPNVATLEEGFKATMKKFWDWIVSVAKKAWNFITTLASKIRAFFSTVKGTISRLSNTLKNRDWDEEKAKDKKFNLAAKSRIFPHLAITEEIKKIFEDLGKSGNELLNTIGKNNPSNTDFSQVAKSYQDKVEKALNEGNEDIKKFISDVKSGNRKTIYGISEVSASDGNIGDWTIEDAKDDTKILAQLALADTIVMGSKKVEDMAKQLDKIAKKYQNLSTNEEFNKEMTGVKNATSTAVKTMNIIVKLSKDVGRYMIYAGKEFIKVQRAFIACTK